MKRVGITFVMYHMRSRHTFAFLAGHEAKMSFLRRRNNRFYRQHRKKCAFILLFLSL